MTWKRWSLGAHLRHIPERTRSVLGGIPTQSVGTIRVISSTPIMPMLVLSVIPESCCEHGLWEAACRRCFSEAPYQLLN